MIKQKLTSAKNFVSDHKLEIALGTGLTAFVAVFVAAVADDPEAFFASLEDPTREVIETATHTIILIEK